jgi:hypothetical protein
MRERSKLTEMLIGRRATIFGGPPPARVSLRSWLKEKLIIYGVLLVCGWLTVLVMYLLGKL